MEADPLFKHLEAKITRAKALRHYGHAGRLIDLTLHFDNKADFSARNVPVFSSNQIGRTRDRLLHLSRQFKADAIYSTMTVQVNGSLPFDHHSSSCRNEF
jgi:hypothetical protein